MLFNTQQFNTSVFGTPVPKLYFGALAVGFSVGVDQFTVTDIRTRGGGLEPASQLIEQSRDMWDLGYWDGKPYPLGGGLVVLLPVAFLDRFTKDDIALRLAAIAPLGAVLVIRYVDAAGNESV
jgi:hypothetical protein